LADFASVTPEEYFYELVYCLLTPQSSAVNAARAVEALRAVDILANDIAPAPLLHQKRFYIRFHNTKARHIVKAKAMFPEILVRLTDSFSSADLRVWLVQNVHGLGWKEASHFLRNIGHRNLAILDRHILKNLKRHNVVKRLPKTLTPRRYLSIEAQFARFSEAVGITIDELDLFFWSRETGEILK
jgi:N-glycosylase/DNA lyase